MSIIPKIATPVSHLTRDQSTLIKLRNVSDCMEMRPGTLDVASNEEVYHCDSIQINHVMSDHSLEHLVNVSKNAANLKLIAFHCATNCDAPVLIGRKFGMGGHMYNRSDMIYNVMKNIDMIRKNIRSDISLAVENNNYYKTEWQNPYDTVTDAEFISDITEAANIEFLFDTSHAAVTAANRGIPYETYIDMLPMHCLKQIQLCQHAFIDDECVDLHELPTASTISRAVTLAFDHKCEYLTIEYYGDCDRLISGIEYMRKVINARGNLQHT